MVFKTLPGLASEDLSRLNFFLQRRHQLLPLNVPCILFCLLCVCLFVLGPLYILESGIPYTHRHGGSIFRSDPPLGSHPLWSSPPSTTKSQFAHLLCSSSGSLYLSSETICALSPTCSFFALYYTLLIYTFMPHSLYSC